MSVVSICGLNATLMFAYEILIKEKEAGKICVLHADEGI